MVQSYHVIGLKTSILWIAFTNKDLFIKNRTRRVVTLALFLFDFLWISLYLRSAWTMSDIVHACLEINYSLEDNFEFEMNFFTKYLLKKHKSMEDIRHTTSGTTKGRKSHWISHTTSTLGPWVMVFWKAYCKCDGVGHEPLLLDSLVQIKLWKSLKLIFLENSFNKDKSVGL